MPALFISHPEVIIDPAVPVPRWGLTDRGVTRMRAFAASPVAACVTEVWASGETKAIEAAGILAGRFGLPVHVDEALHENDRTATGFLPPEEFGRVADSFFARPDLSVRGWERAIDAQARVAAALDRILAGSANPEGLAIVAHGAVGTLLLCQYLGEPISRARDQPFPGHYWTFDPATRRADDGWRALPSP